MITKKEILFTIILTINLFCLSFFYTKNWTEKTSYAFKGYRTHGFPFAVVSISVTTEDPSEALKVYSLSNNELLTQGWNLTLGSDNLHFLWAIFVNFLFFLIASSILVGLFNAFISILTTRIREGKRRGSYS